MCCMFLVILVNSKQALKYGKLRFHVMTDSEIKIIILNYYNIFIIIIIIKFSQVKLCSFIIQKNNLFVYGGGQCLVS